MESQMGFPTNYAMDYAGKMEKMYPDVYRRMYPHVQDTVNSLSDEGMYNLTNEDVDRLTEESIRRSGALNDPPAGHNRNTIGDMTRALVVREMFDRHRRRRLFPFFPLFFFPFDGRDFDRDRDRDRDHDRDRDRDHDRDRDRNWY